MSMRKLNSRGFTLIELMIVVAIIGVLAALAIYGVSRYLSQSKTTEARMALGRMAKDASAAWEREGMDSAILGLGSSAANAHSLCTSSSAIPTAAASVKGAKYQSSPTEWQQGSSDSTGWACLKFSMKDPQYYQYQYLSTGGGATDTTFTAQGNGDLNGDGVLSTFQLYGKIQLSGTALAVTVAPKIAEFQAEE